MKLVRQYQKIVQTYIFCKMHNLNFVYEPLEIVEHNYDNDIEILHNDFQLYKGKIFTIKIYKIQECKKNSPELPYLTEVLTRI